MAKTFSYLLFNVWMLILLVVIFYGQEVHSYLLTIESLPQTMRYFSLAAVKQQGTLGMQLGSVFVLFLIYSCLTVTWFPESKLTLWVIALINQNRANQ